MLTTAGSMASAILANELDSSTGDGCGRGLASGAPANGRAARTPLETIVPMAIPRHSVTTTANAARYRRAPILASLGILRSAIPMTIPLIIQQIYLTRAYAGRQCPLVPSRC